MRESRGEIGYHRLMKPTKLLNDDGTASMSTMIMLSHHAFRRDAGLFERALDNFDPTRMEALKSEWEFFAAALHGHHQKEDGDIFPPLSSGNSSLAATFARLSAQHTEIDPLLLRGKEAFARLPEIAEARVVVRAIRTLLDTHLDLEEATIIPFLRGAREFPAPENEEWAALYAQGFAWSLEGIAPEVAAKVADMLPASVRDRLPAAQKEFAARCTNVWGAPSGTASTTSIPASQM